MAPIVFERKYGRPAESILLPIGSTSLVHVCTLYDPYTYSVRAIPYDDPTPTTELMGSLGASQYT